MDINKLFGVKPKEQSVEKQNATGSTKKEKNKKPSTGKAIIPKTTQQTLPYAAIYRNGIIMPENGYYTKLYKIEDINFRTAGPEEQTALFQRICDMLNTLSSVNLQFVCFNRSVSEQEFSENHLLKMENDNLNEYRNEINEILLSHIHSGNNIVSDKYIVVTAKSANIDEAAKSIAHLEPTIDEVFRSIGNSSATPLSGEEAVTLLYRAYHPYESEAPYINFDDMAKQGIKTKDIIAPSSIQVNKDNMIIDDIYTATLYLAVFPNTLSSEFIAELNDIPCHLITSVHMISIAQDKAAKLISNRITNITANVQQEQKKASRRGYSGDLISPDMQRAREDAMELLDEIKSKNQRLFYVTVAIQIYAETKEELTDNIKLIQTTASKYLCNIQKLGYQQENGMATTLPIGKNKIEVRRLLTTEMAALLTPFSAQVLTQKGGIYYGLNAVSGTLILLNRLMSKNANGVIFGSSGSGKSFAAKREMINVLLGTNSDVFVVDPDGEYAPLAEMLGGQIIKIGAGLKTYINPLDMDIRYGADNTSVADPITLKSDYMCSLCETIMGGRYGLSPVQKSVIDRCVREVYQPYMEYIRQHPEETYNAEHMPTLVQFYEILLSQPEPEAQNVALSLELYCTGSLDAFAHTTNVETHSRFVVYDIVGIGEGLHEIGLQVCLNDIWNRTIANHSLNKNTWFYLDEFYLLCQHESSAKFLQQIFKRARKWGGVPTGITQDVADMLQNRECQAVINNCDFVMMLNQSAIGRTELSAMYNISTTLQRHITDAPRGHGLLYTGSTIVPFDDKYPKDTKSYAAMTTTMEDVARLREVNIK